jgi:hypothetical protein
MNKEDEKFKRLAEDIDLLNEVYELLEKDDEEICRNIKHAKVLMLILF